MTIFEMMFDPELANQGVNAISLVEKPAIESNFVALKDVPVQFAAVNERRVVMGAVLIPNKPILRRDDKTGEDFTIYFSGDTVQKVAEHFLLRGLQRATTVEHAVNAEGLTLVESWLVVDPEKDKSAFYNLSVPAGTWMGAVKVENDEIWDEFVKTGKLNGFSIEGYFQMEAREKLEASKVKKTLGEMIEELSEQFK